MKFKPDAVMRAIRIAQAIGSKIDPSFGAIPMPKTGEGIPLERARGGKADYIPAGDDRRQQNLMEWFGQSHLHDNGVPLTYYHGTSKDKEFSKFNVGRHGAWFTTDPSSASDYAERNDSQNLVFNSNKGPWGGYDEVNTASRVIPAFLKAENPYKGEAPEFVRHANNYKKAQSDWFDHLRAQGYDSWVPDSANGNLAVMLSHPGQIKSATGNVGTFDGENPDMNRASGGAARDVRMPLHYPAHMADGGTPPDFKVDNAMSVFPKPQRMWDEDKPGGAYLSMPDKKDITGHRAAQAAIGIGEGGKPYFHASRDAVDETGTPGKGSALVKTNLFKQKAGWKWKDAPEGHEGTNTIVSVEHRGNHHYVLGAHFPNGVDLSRYPDAPSEPRLRPTTRGNVELGPQVGSILVRGREHPVHSHAIVREYGGRVGYADGGSDNDSIDREGNRSAFLEGNHPLVPDVVYHGTDRDISQFDTEQPRRVDAGMGEDYTDTGWYGKGHYLTPYKRAASHFASDYRMGGEHGPNVMPVHLSLKNPFIVKVPQNSSGATDMDRAMDEAGFSESSDPRMQAKRNGERLPSEQTKMLMDKGHDGVIVLRQSGIKDPVEEKAAETRRDAAWKRYLAAQDAYYETPLENAYNGAEIKPIRDEFEKSRRDYEIAKEAAGGEYKPHEFVVFKPHQIKSAIGNSGRYDPNEPEINKAAGGRTGYALGGSDDDSRDLNEFGLYSHAAEEALGLQKTDTPENYKQMLLKRGVKPAEFEWSGYDKAFADQPQVTREQVSGHFENGMPDVFETQYGVDPRASERQEMRSKHDQEYTDYVLPRLGNGNHGYFNEPEYKEMIERQNKEKREFGYNPYSDAPFHDSYTIPGGDNYREILAKHDNQNYSFPGVGSHFGGDENILASLRLKDRKDNEGDNVLHLEELQSDWGQNARKHGIKDDDRIFDARMRYLKSTDAIREAEESEDAYKIMEAEKERREAVKEFNSAINGVESAPYIGKTDDWVDFGLKRALLEAAKGGQSGDYHKLAWSPGDVQADRYDLSKHIGEIRHSANKNGTYDIEVYSPNGKFLTAKNDMEGHELPNLVGKELSEKIFSGEGEGVDNSRNYSHGDWRSLSGLDLKVGGEGMRKFYDQMLPKRLLKLARMHDPDAKLVSSEVEHPSTSNYRAKSTQLPALEITPRMRESILKKGFPAYAQGGEVDGYDNGGSVPLTNPVYHGVKGESVSSPIASGLDMEMFDRENPGTLEDPRDKASLFWKKPNRTALMLGPHVSRDPNIAGDFRFTTGEYTNDSGKRVGARAQGKVMPLNTFSDEKFFPVEQKFDRHGIAGPASYDDQAVHNTVYADIMQNNPKLAHEILTERGMDEDLINSLLQGFQSGQPFDDPLSVQGFKWNNAKHYLDNTSRINPSPRLAKKAVMDFRKRMRDRGYVGLSYINTDEDEVASNIDPTKTIEDKKCYIVFPQRDKETGWYPLRFKHGAAYNPEDKGKPGLHLATGGEADGMEDEENFQAPENPNGGLMFSPDANAARLQTKLKRDSLVASGARPDAGLPKNPRTVIKAPEVPEGSEAAKLPDFVTGDINFEDWRKRHEQILNDNEIHHSSQWYKNIYGNFLNYYPDPAKAKKMMRAWLVAQQNVSPAGAMNNVLMQQEQMDRGEPEELWKAGGMPNPTAAARSVLSGKEIKGGVGQKISDFVDSAEGKSTRSWMGDHPHGGSPFVVDVHTARDTGMVDQELINHLTRLGYDPKELAKLKIDMTTSPSEPAYENRAKFGRDLTDHLNQMGWKGRQNWTPEEIQAVGWMGMTKLTRNAEEDSESGLGRNMRRISYELSPGEGSPWEAKYGKGFESLPDEDRYGITRKMADSAMKHAQQLSGIDVNSLVHGTGAWENYQNPAAVAQSLSTQRGADIAAAALGHMLQQTEVWHNRVKPMSNAPKGFALDFIEKGSKNLAEPGALRDFWEKVMEADPHGIVKGYQPITLPTGETGLRALFDKGGKKTQGQIESLLADHEKDEDGNVVRENPFRSMLESHPFDLDIMGHEAEITKHRNDWKAQNNGEGYISRLVELLGNDPSAKLNSARQQLEKEFEQHLDEAHARQGTSWRKASSKPLMPAKANGGAINKAILIAMRAKKRSPIAIK